MAKRFFFLCEEFITKEYLHSLTYKEWLANKFRANHEVDCRESRMHSMASTLMKRHNLSYDVGLLPAEVIKNKRYIFLEQCFSRYFQLLRTFNQNSPKKYKQRHANESRVSKSDKFDRSVL